MNVNDLDRGLWQWRAGTKALTLSMNAQASCTNYSAQFLTEWLSKNGKEVKVVRFPEKKHSKNLIEFFQMDLASPKALSAFADYGADDAVETYRMCQDVKNEDGRIISEIFTSMPELSKKENEGDNINGLQ